MQENPKHKSKKTKFRGNRLKINTTYLPVFLWNWLVSHHKPRSDKNGMVQKE